MIVYDLSKIITVCLTALQLFQLTCYKGQVRVTQTPVPLDYETVKAYNLSIQACDDQFCSEPGYLVVDVLDAMEPPVFTPKSGTYDLHENTVSDLVLF